MFRNPIAQRLIAAFVLTTFTSLTMYPLTAAAQVKDAVERAGLLPKQKDEGLIGNARRYLDKLAGNKAPSAAPSADERFAQLLNAIHEDLKAIVPQTAMPKQAYQYAGGRRAEPPQAEANGAKGGMQTRAIGPDMRIDTERSKEILKPLPGTDMAARINSIKNKAAQVKGLYADIDQSFQDTEQHLRDAKLPQAILDRQAQAVAQYESRKAEFERFMDKVEQAPANSAGQQSALADLGSFMAKYPNAKPHQYTDPNKLPFGTNNGKVRAPNLTKAQYQASLFPPKYKKVMLAGPIPDGLKLAQATLPEVPNAPDTAATDDAQITPAIKDKATELNNNPVQIYNWVRNNIAFIPSYGSIQGSDMTLQNKRGNAFDTASLLIALYRAAGIPARYVYGTIEVPAEQVMNWVGGVTKPQAAQSLLGQGGIPNIALVSGGTVKAIRMEHVWVEAYVDYTPSRGAVNKTPNAWVPMDASFKQYDLASKDNMADVLGFDKSAYQQAFLQSAVIDSNGNRMLGGNSVALGNQIESYQHKAIAWAKSIGLSYAVDQLQGKKAIRPMTSPILLGTLPYKVVIQANTFQSLPANLRWAMTVSYFASETDATYDNAIFAKTIPLSKIGNQKLGLSFAPATDADAATLRTLQLQNASSLPAYLIKGIPRLTLDATTLAEGGPTSFGTQQIVVISMSDPQGQNTAPASYKVTAGDETVFAVNAAGTTQATLDDRFAKTASNTASENLQTVGTVYWMLHDLGDQLAASAHKVVAVRLPSVGAFVAPLVPRYFFGIARSGSYLGRYADVKRVAVAATTNEGQVPVAFMRQIGLQGSNAEGLAFDITFKREVGSGGSATRFLNRTLAHGGAVLRITTDNQAVLQVLSISEDVKTDIRNAIAAGKETIVPDRELANGNWKGLGYILVDPTDGSGAYLIDGGFNGGTDGPGCDGQPATAPAAQPVEKPSMGLYGMLAFAVIVILAAPFVIELAVAIILSGTLIAASTAANAAPGPGSGLPSGLNSIWESTFGNAYGKFPSGPNYPGDGIKPPGNCSAAQHDALEAEKSELCGKPSKCDKNECNLSIIQERIANRNACIGKRLEIMLTCFRGGDGGHWGHIQQELNGLATCRNCLTKALANQCQK